MACGIYSIKNKITNITYVGQSKNINFRFKTHLRELRKNIHYNSHLQKHTDETKAKMSLDRKWSEKI